MKLDAQQLDAARAALTGPQGDTLIRFMAGQSVARDGAVSDDEIKALARDCGWLAAQSDQRTTLGFMVSDSCREYLFWRERDRALPFENSQPHLSDALFKGKYVVEIGSGMGANLMSLAHRTGRLCGVEPVEAYVQLGAIFCACEGLAPPETHIGGAEALPFETGALDLVLCVSSHQYFDIIPAFAEFARVLKPGGELVIIGAVFSSYARRVPDHVRSEGAKAVTITLLNSRSYTGFGKRLIGNRGAFSTSRPIYPTAPAMLRWLRKAGFEQVNPPAPVGPETCFHVRLPEGMT